MREKVIRVLVAGFLLSVTPAINSYTPLLQSAQAADCSTGYEVGYQGPLTGPEAALGIDQMRGAQLALEQFVASNPSVNVKTTLQLFDDQGDPAVAQPIAAAVVAHQCLLGLVGPAYSGATRTSLPVFEAAGLPMITPSAGNPILRSYGPTVFHRMINPAGEYIAQYVAEKGLHHPGLLYASDYVNPYTMPAGSFVESITTTVVDLQPVVAKMKAAGVDSIFLAFYTGMPNILTLLKSATSAAGLNVPVVLTPETDIDGISGTSLGGFETLTALSGIIPVNKYPATFKNALRAKFGAEPGLYSLESFEATNFFLQGLKAGATTRAQMLTFINSNTYTGPGGALTFTSTGDRNYSRLPTYLLTGTGTSLPADFPLVLGSPETVTGIALNTTNILTFNVRDWDTSTAKFKYYLATNTSAKPITGVGDSSTVVKIPVVGTHAKFGITPMDSNMGSRDISASINLVNGKFSNINIAGVAQDLSKPSITFTLAKPKYFFKVPSALDIRRGTVTAVVRLKDPTQAAYASDWEAWSGSISTNQVIGISTPENIDLVLDISVPEAETSYANISRFVIPASQLNSDGIIHDLTLQVPAITLPLSSPSAPSTIVTLQKRLSNGTYQDVVTTWADANTTSVRYPAFESGTYRVRVRPSVWGDTKWVLGQVYSSPLTYSGSGIASFNQVTVGSANVTGTVVTNSTVGNPKRILSYFDIYSVDTLTGVWTYEFSSGSDDNNQFSFTFDPGTYKFVWPAVSNMTRETADTCVVTTGSITCNLNLKAPIIRGRAYAENGVDPLAYAHVYLYSGANNYKVFADENGYFGLSPSSLVTGIYSLVAYPGDSVESVTVNQNQQTIITSTLTPTRTETVTVTDLNGSVEKVLTYTPFNLELKVVGPNGPYTSGFILIEKESGTDNWVGTLKAYANSQGEYGALLEAGRYRFTSLDDPSSGGMATSVICTVVTGQATQCTLTLKSMNVTGAITGLAGGVVTEVNFFNGFGGEIERIATVFGSTYTVGLTTGTWYSQVFYKSTTGLKVFYGPAFSVITDSATVNNIAIPTENFKMKILNAAGEVTSSNVRITPLRTETTTVPSRVLGGGLPLTVDSAGTLSLSLGDGIYLMVLEPFKYGVDTGTLVYTVEVNAGTVSRVFRVESQTATASFSGGYWNLKLGKESIYGQLFTPNGVTPISGAEVKAKSLDGEVSVNGGWGTKDLTLFFGSTSATGTFGSRSELWDGRWEVTFTLPSNLASQYGSPIKKVVSVINGRISESMTVVARGPNLVGTIRGPSGISQYNRVYMMGWNESTNFWDKANYTSIVTGADGKFSFLVAPGKYQVTASSDYVYAMGEGISTECIVTDTQTVFTCDLTLPGPTIRGTITGPLGVASNTYVNLEKYDGNQWQSYSGKGTDGVGVVRFSVPPGTYRLIANGDILSSGGGRTVGSNCVVVDTSTTTVCNVSLTAPNVSGTITIGGVAPASSYGITLLPDWDMPGNAAKSYQYLSSLGQGRFAGTAEPGTYVLMVNVYSSQPSYTAPGQVCVVPASGSVVCNGSIPTKNFAFQVKNPAGTVVNNNFYAAIQMKIDSHYAWICCSYPSNSGLLENSIRDGEYILRLYPYSPNATNGLEVAYEFIVEGGIVKNLKLQGTTTLLTSTNGVYQLAFKKPGLIGNVYGPTGTTGLQNSRVDIRVYSSDQKWSSNYSAYTDSNGGFSFDIKSLKEKLESEFTKMGFNTGPQFSIRAYPPDGNTNYSPSPEETFTVVNGEVIGNLVLRLTSPNVSGTVTGPLGASPSNYLTIYKLEANGDQTQILNIITNNSGQFAVKLEPGKYKFRANQDLNSAGGNSVTSDVCEVVANTPKICNIALAVPNLIGTVTLAGVAVNNGAAHLLSEETGFIDQYSAITSAGKYAFTALPGKYLIQFYISQTNSWTPGAECVVPSSGSITCNSALPATNFKFRIAQANGTVMTTGAYAYQGKNFGTRKHTFCCSYVSNSTYAILKSSLLDGTYTFSVQPDGSNQKLGGNQEYTVVVSSGVVTSVAKTGTSTTLVADNSGVFTLRLSSASLAGTVVAPDGTTPVPQTGVSAYKDGSYWANYGTSSDNTGYFTFNQLPDGKYEVIARAPRTDATKADSAMVEGTVSSGQGNESLVLRLRTPNIVGVVRGPLNVSPFNYVEIFKRDEKGGFSNIRGVENRTSDGQGAFGFRVDPGKYVLRAQADMKYAGGMAAWSAECVVPNSGVATCDIFLTTPNLTFQIVNTDKVTAVEGAYPWINYISDGSKTEIKNFSPSVNWLDNGTTLQSTLEDGRWRIILNPPSDSSDLSQTSYIATVVNGVLTRMENEQGDTFTATAGKYLLPLTGVNFTGTISYQGQTFTGNADVNLQRLDGDYFGYVQYRWTSAGTYGFKVPAGTYRVEVRAYSKFTGKNYGVSRSALCNVPTSGSVTCDVEIQDPNLKGKITDSSGNTVVSAGAYIHVKVGERLYWDRHFDMLSGTFDAYVADGTYQLNVYPYSEVSSSFTNRTYTVKVVGGSISLIQDQFTNETLTATGGVYSFKLGTTSVSGTVLLPGSSTVVVPNTQIMLAYKKGSYTYWSTVTYTNNNGQFGINLGNGTYQIQAVPNGAAGQYGKSLIETVTVTNGISTPITLRLRAANLTGRIVTPGSNPIGLANVNVSLYIDGEQFNVWTDNDGKFGVYVDRTSLDCPSKCKMTLNYYKSTEYTAKSYSISSVGEMGDKAIGGVNTRVTVNVPQTGSTTVLNPVGPVSVQIIDSVTGIAKWMVTSQTDALGQIGLTLEEGLHYKIWAYPNATFSSAFSVKILDIPAYSVASYGTISMTFDRPNLSFIVKGPGAGLANARGWYEISKNDGSGNYIKYSNNYLDGQGRGAVLLENGSYKITYWPGNIVAAQLTSSVTVSGGIASGTGITSGIATVTLPGGNISGYIKNDSATAISGALISAIPGGDTTKAVSTKADENGYYELNVDARLSWVVKAMDPVTASVGSRTLTAQSTETASQQNQNVTITIVAP